MPCAKALLLLGKGDTSYSDRNRARLVRCAQESGFDVQQADYHEIGKVQPFRNETINIMFFFPYSFWNANCEFPEDTRLYGTSRLAYGKFRDYFLQVRQQLESAFAWHRLHYVIPPEDAPIDRDKVETISRLRACSVQTSEPLAYSSIDDIVANLTRDRGIFIKCRYGAEGKGITVLHHDRWVTNYTVGPDGLENHGANERWVFSDITRRFDLLEQLLRHDVIVEKEIVTPDVFGGDKFDLRAYVINGKVPHLFVRLNDPRNEVTNFSQGGTVRHHPYTSLGAECLHLASETARQAAEAMGLRFAGVDIMFDGNLRKARVVELQAFTDFPDTRYFDMARYMVDGKTGLFI